jgi:hypothetical protein
MHGGYSFTGSAWANDADATSPMTTNERKNEQGRSMGGNGAR